MSNAHESELEEHAWQVVGALKSDEQRKLPVEMLRLDDSTRAILFDVGPVDYILTMTRVPVPRKRPIEQ